MKEFVEKEASHASIRKRKLVCGVGYNDAWYITSSKQSGVRVLCPYYRLWVNMLTRCYSPKYHKEKPSYEDCFVSQSWHKFSAFKLWVQSQRWKGMSLDKDLLYSGNKMYGPDVCLFVPNYVNSLFSGMKKRGLKHLPGVHYREDLKKYRSKIKIRGRQCYLGNFLTEQEAHQAYVVAKAAVAREVAAQQSNQRLTQALLRIANELLVGDYYEIE